MHENEGTSKTVSMEQIAQWLGSFWLMIEEALLGLLDLAIALADATTADHLEGAAVMALILLGPSLAVGLINGFW
ncbi:MAG: hypothetical protein OEU92_11960 [Alphaproteobacteria bacterium]|nr:hypothetical protein [Alphaproteobacteria bacterium]